jgi:hypothetical protein
MTTAIQRAGLRVTGADATRGDDPGIFDALGRQVLLHGVNLNSLGDYYQASPELPPVFALDPAFFESMAAQGSMSCACC